MNPSDIPNRWLAWSSGHMDWQKLDFTRHELVSAQSPCFDAGRCYLPAWSFVRDLRITDFERVLTGGQFLCQQHLKEPIAAWRAAKDIVDIDPDILKALMDSDVEAIPPNVLLRLPSWAVFIPLPADFPSLDEPLKPSGVLVNYSDCSPRSGARYPVFLRAVFFYGPSGEQISLPLVLAPHARTVREAVRAGADFFTGMAGMSPEKVNGPRYKAMYELSGRVARPLISILLYLISEHEKRLRSGRPAVLVRPQPRRVRGGWRIVPPKQPRCWKLGCEAGERIREGLRRSGRTGQHASPRPHIRRGHWHLYWTGRRKFGPDETPVAQIARLRWLPPMTVALLDGDETGAAPGGQSGSR